MLVALFRQRRRPLLLLTAVLLLASVLFLSSEVESFQARPPYCFAARRSSKQQLTKLLTLKTTPSSSSSSEEQQQTGASPPSNKKSVKKPLSSSSKNTNTSSKSLFRAMDEFGQSLKGRALKASSNAARADNTTGQMTLYVLQTCVLYTLFIIYRAYRGFFVIMPAVFREVYRKMETAVDTNPFNDDDQPDVTINHTDTAVGKLRAWRTRITVSVLASIVTMSYAIGGACRVVGKFFRTLTKTSGDVSGSFAAAVNEQERNEDKLLQKMTTNNNNTTSNTTMTIINGQQQPQQKQQKQDPSSPSSSSSDLAP